MIKPSVAIVGTGRLASALAKQLVRCGYQIKEILAHRDVERGRRLARQVKARASTFARARFDADLVWLCVPDAAIAECAARVANANWRGRAAFHSSGVQTSDALRVLAGQGAALASVHPLMTFVKDASPDLTGVAFALEGNPRALKLAATIVRDLGGGVVRVRRGDKEAYHAFATMICPLLISLMAAAEAAAEQAHFSRRQARRLAMPIIAQTLINYRSLGPARSFTGPIARGDVETVRLHLAALAKAPAAEQAYVALARAALVYLPAAHREELRRLLTPGGA